MKLIYAQQTIDSVGRSIFLAGPTPRRSSVPSWRPEAIEIFNKYEYKGTLLIPEDKYGGLKGHYDDQVEWEEAALRQANCILFWIPREMTSMPALTTNDEWGTWKYSGKVVLGTPFTAQSVKYQQYYARKLGIPCAYDLQQTVLASMEIAEKSKTYLHLRALIFSFAHRKSK